MQDRFLVVRSADYTYRAIKISDIKTMYQDRGTGSTVIEDFEENQIGYTEESVKDLVERINRIQDLVASGYQVSEPTTKDQKGDK